MGAIADLPLQQGGAIADLPVQGKVLTPEQADIRGSQGAGSVTSGARSSFNSLGAGLHNLAGTAGEALGLTDFAAARFAEADEYTKFAEAVGPLTRDVRAVKDWASLTDFVGGLVGQGLASAVPAVAGAAVGGPAGGLRGAMVGLGAGSFVPNAGEQATNLRGVDATPGTKLANIGGVAAINTALDMIGGAAARAVRGIARPSAKGVVSGLAKSTLGEGVVEGGQDVVSQGGVMALDPGKQFDPWSVANNAIGGLVGGAAIGGIGKAVEVAPGAAVDTFDAFKRKFGRQQDVVDPDSPEAIQKIADDPSLKDDASILDAIDKGAGRAKEELLALTQRGRALFDEHFGEGTDYKKIIEAGGQRLEELYKRAQDVTQEVRDKPEVKAAYEQSKAALQKGAAWAKGYGEGFMGKEKKSLVSNRDPYAPDPDRPYMSRNRPENPPLPASDKEPESWGGAERPGGRTTLDFAIHDAVLPLLPESTRKHLSGDELLELTTGQIKHAALHATGQRDEVAGPAPGARHGKSRVVTGRGEGENPLKTDVPGEQTYPFPTGERSESDRVTQPVRLPSGFLKLLGPDAAKIIEVAQNVLKGGGVPFRGDAKRAVAEATGRAKTRKTGLEGIVHEHMNGDDAKDPARRKEATSMFLRLMDNTGEGHGMALREAATYVAGSGGGGKKMMDAIDSYLAHRDAREPETYLSDEEHEEFAKNAKTSDDVDDEGKAKQDLSGGLDTDPRLSEPYKSLEAAVNTVKGLEVDYRQGKVKFKVRPDMKWRADERHPDKGQMQPTGKYVIEADDREASTGFDGEPKHFDKTRGEKGEDVEGHGAWSRIQDNNTSNKAGFEHGTIGVELTDGKKVRVSLRALTKETVRTLERDGDSGMYPHDIIMSGLGQLMSDERVKRVVTKFGKDGVDLTGNKDTVGQWTLPDDTPFGPINGTQYTWGMVKARSKMSAADLERMQAMEELVAEAEQAPPGRDPETRENKRVREIAAELKGMEEHAARDLAVAREDLAVAKEGLSAVKGVHMDPLLRDVVRAKAEVAAKDKAATAAFAKAKETAAGDSGPNPLTTAERSVKLRTVTAEARLEYEQALDALDRAEKAADRGWQQNRDVKRAKAEGTLPDDGPLKSAVKDAREAKNSALAWHKAVVGAKDRVDDEMARRRDGDDTPHMDIGSMNVDKSMLDGEGELDTERTVQEDTGANLMGKQDRARGAGFQPHEVGQSEFNNPARAPRVAGEKGIRRLKSLPKEPPRHGVMDRFDEKGNKLKEMEGAAPSGEVTVDRSDRSALSESQRLEKVPVKVPLAGLVKWADARRLKSMPHASTGKAKLYWAKGGDEKIAKVAATWAKMLRLPSDVVLLSVDHIDDAPTPVAKHLAGYFESNADTGALHIGANGTSIILYRPSSNQGEVLTSIAHELGHAFDAQILSTPEYLGHRAAIAARFAKAVVAGRKDPLAYGLNRYSPDTVSSHMEGSSDIEQLARIYNMQVLDGEMDSLTGAPVQYALQFKEWWAEQVSKFLSTEAKPVDDVDSFFKGVADRLRMYVYNVVQAIAAATGRKYTGRSDPRVSSFLQGWIDGKVDPGFVQAAREDYKTFTKEQRGELERALTDQPMAEWQYSRREGDKVKKSLMGLRHVSPHKFDKFDWRNNLGRGEGVQMFGAGTYLSTADSVHAYYKAKFNRVARGHDAEDKLMRMLGDRTAYASTAAKMALYDSKEEALQYLRDELRDVGGPDSVDTGHDWPAILKEHIEKLEAIPPAALRGMKYDYNRKAPTYHNTLHADMHEIMDWDKPLSEQSDFVKKALKEAGFEEGRKSEPLEWDERDGAWKADKFLIMEDGAYGTFSLEYRDAFHGNYDTLSAAKAAADSMNTAGDPTGEQMYIQLAEKLGSQTEASNFLGRQGIVGHVYDAAGGKEKHQRNYVVYDDSKLDTTYVEFSKIPATGGPLTDAQKDEVRAYVEKVLGKAKAKVAFKNMAEAGTFRIDPTGVEQLRIATNAQDAWGTGHHEAAHALFARLMDSDKKTAQQLLAAAGSAPIVTRLRELLKEHPEALKQLTAKGQMEMNPQWDGARAGHEAAEERIAYMFQFWATGDMSVGPKTKGIFETVKKYFKKLTGLWSESFTDGQNVERAYEIFNLFDRGDLSDRNTVAEVIRSKSPQGAFSRATEVLEPVWDGVKKLLYTSVGSVKAMNIPAFSAVADLMHTAAFERGAKPGFNNAKHVRRNIFMTQVTDALRGLDEVAQRQLMEGLQAGTATGANADKVHRLLSDVFAYAKGKGVKAVVWSQSLKDYEEHVIEAVEKYFPRYYDAEYISEHRKAFVDMLMRNKLDRAAAEQVADSVMKTGAVDPAENDELVGLTYFAPNTQSRKLDVPAAELAPFLRKDLYGQLNSYVSYMVRRAEYTERFGNQGQGIRDAITTAAKEQGATVEQVNTFNKAVQAWEGSLGHDIKPGLKGVFGAMTTYQNIRLLPLALFSSLVDPMGVMVRGGTVLEAGGAFMRGVRGLVSESKDDMYHLALAAGTIADSLDDHMIADAYGSNYMPDALKYVNDKFFRWNGMESWNRQMRVAATGAAVQFLIRHAKSPNAHSERYLSELGLEAGDVAVGADGTLDMKDQKIRDAVNQWVDGAVLRPTAAIRPTWMSDPHWMLVSHLKQYTYSFQKTIIARVVHEAAHGNYTPALALTSYVPMIIAADVLRAMLTPGGGDDDARKRMTMAEVIGRGIQRSGIPGPGQYVLDSYGDLGHDRVPFASFAGPSFQQLIELGSAAAGPTGDVSRELLRAVPGAQLFR